MKNTRSSGFTLIEILISIGIVSAAMLALTFILQAYYTAGSRADVRSSMLDVEMQTYFVQENIEEWIAKTLDASQPQFYNAAIATCLVNNGAASCPAALSSADVALINDAELSSYISLGKTVSTLRLKDIEGKDIAGPLNAPIYYSSNGMITTASQAAFATTGLMVRDNASGTPGKVTFFVRIKDIPKKNAIESKARWLRINVGTRWQLIASDVTGSCNAGEFVTGINPSTGGVTCRSTQSQCTMSQYVIGINSSGQVMCEDLPPTATPVPYAPPATVACDSWAGSGADCTVPGGRAIAGITVAERRSRASCSGGNASFSGSTIKVRNGCRATFNVFYH